MREANRRAYLVVALCVGVVISHGPDAAARTTPVPRQGRTAVVARLGGRVFITAPGSTARRRLRGRGVVRMGSTIDTTNGKVRLTTATDARGHTQSGVFYGAAFVVTQARSGAPLTTLRLVGGDLGSCAASAGRGHGRPHASRRAKGRRLYGRGHGLYQTVARYTTGRVHGTVWVTSDTCQGSSVQVQRGTVTTTDRLGQSQTLSDGSVLNEFCVLHGSPIYCVLTIYAPAHTTGTGASAKSFPAFVGFIAVIGAHGAQLGSYRSFDLCTVDPAGVRRCQAHGFQAPKPGSTPDFYLIDFSMGCRGSPGPGAYQIQWVAASGALLGDTPVQYRDAAAPISCFILHGS